MKEPGPDRLSEEEAARLWQRAAQLQAEAAHREESEGDAGADPHEEEASDEDNLVG